MKNLLKQLGINVTELAYLLLIPEQTVFTWFNRGNRIPSQHDVYLKPLEKYQTQKTAEDLERLSVQWESEHEALRQKEGAAAMKTLLYQLQQFRFQLEKLKIKESKLLNRWHLSENYPQFLASELQNTELVQDWCRMIGRKSKLLFGDTRQAIWKLEQKIAGLEAELAYWEGENSTVPSIKQFEK